MLQDEFPHEIVFLEKTRIPDGGGGYETGWAEKLSFNGFLDTPTSQEMFKAQQLNYTLDRSLYYPFREDVQEQMRCRYRNATYEIVGKPEDQGGQHAVMKVSLKLVANG